MTRNRVRYPANRGAGSQTPRHGRLRAHYRHLTLWTLQAWLTMFYLGAGYAKLTQPTDLLGVLMTWPGLVDPALVRILGVLDVVLGVCLIPALFSLAPPRSVPRWILTIIMGLSLGFFVFHASERNIALVLTNALLIASSGLVLWARGGREHAPK